LHTSINDNKQIISVPPFLDSTHFKKKISLMFSGNFHQFYQTGGRKMAMKVKRTPLFKPLNKKSPYREFSNRTKKHTPQRIMRGVYAPVPTIFHKVRLNALTFCGCINVVIVMIGWRTGYAPDAR
jgi:hypothetical protein